MKQEKPNLKITKTSHFGEDNTIFKKHFTLHDHNSYSWQNIQKDVKGNIHTLLGSAAFLARARPLLASPPVSESDIF